MPNFLRRAETYVKHFFPPSNSQSDTSRRAINYRLAEKEHAVSLAAAGPVFDASPTGDEPIQDFEGS